MFEKIKSFLYSLNEAHFSIIVLAIAIAISYVAGITENGTTEVLGNCIVKASTYLISATGLTALYGTLKLNVRDEILTEQNVALGILLAGLYLGLGFALGG